MGLGREGLFPLAADFPVAVPPPRINGCKSELQRCVDDICRKTVYRVSEIRRLSKPCWVFSSTR